VKKVALCAELVMIDSLFFDSLFSDHKFFDIVEARIESCGHKF